MKQTSFSLFLLLTLAACTPATQEPTSGATPSSASSVQEMPSSSETSSAQEAKVIPVEQALNKTFTSQKLGISLQYPSTAFLPDCDEVPVAARETEYAVEFVAERELDPTCASPLVNDVWNTVYVQRATTMADVRQFVDRVFSPDCVITENEPYEQDGDTLTVLSLESKNPPKDEPDFACGEALRWNKTAGVVLFSPLGSKTGGDYHWRSPQELLMPDGSTEYAFDYPIMLSIRYLEP